MIALNFIVHNLLLLDGKTTAVDLKKEPTTVVNLMFNHPDHEGSYALFIESPITWASRLIPCGHH